MDRKCLSSAAILISAIAFSGAAALATPIVVVTSGAQRIRTFDSATPGIFATDQLITGLMAGDVINAIDRRPSNSQIYGLTSNSNRLYTLDASTAARPSYRPPVSAQAVTPDSISILSPMPPEILRSVFQAA